MRSAQRTLALDRQYCRGGDKSFRRCIAGCRRGEAAGVYGAHCSIEADVIYGNARMPDNVHSGEPIALATFGTPGAP